ncbi:hypothetical protein N7501_001246 [Penicillium viridicatum]|nr:hypothetical protein N7501_001246 [Penicillium viridicatum]
MSGNTNSEETSTAPQCRSAEVGESKILTGRTTLNKPQFFKLPACTQRVCAVAPVPGHPAREADAYR